MAVGSYWTPAFVKLLAFELLCQFGTNLVNPIVSNYAVALGATVGIAGFLAGFNSLCAMFLRPFGGLLLARFSKRRLLTVAAVAFAASSFLCAALSSVSGLGVSRVILGAAFVIKSSLVMALASISVPRDCVGRGVGVIGLSSIVASALGPGMGSWMGSSFGYHASFMVSGTLFALAVLMSLSLDEPSADRAGEELSSRGRQKPSGGALRAFFSEVFHLKTFPLAGLVALLGLIFGSMTALVLLVCEHRGIDGGASFFFAYAIVAFAVRPFSSKAFDAKGLGALYYPTAVATCLSVIVLAFAGSVVAVIASAIFLALGQGSLYPLLQAESVRCVSAEEAPLAANTFLLGADVGMSLGPIVSGVVFQAFGSTVMLLSLLVAGAALLVFYPAYACYSKTAFGDL